MKKVNKRIKKGDAKPMKGPRSTRFRCDRCGELAMFDGRCGDGPVLLCDCNKSDNEFLDKNGKYDSGFYERW